MVHSRSGFTLIELLLAVAVVGMATGMVMVNFGGVTQSERLRAAARKLAGMSDFIRSQSAGAKQYCYFDIELDKGMYRFRREPDQDEFGRFVHPDSGDPLTVDELEDWRASFQWEPLPKGVNFSKLWCNRQMYYDKDWQWVEYRPDGTASSFILWLEAKDGETTEAFSIIVNGLTGKSEVLKGQYLPAEAQESDFTDVMGNVGSGR